MNIGNTIRTRRRARDMTQEKLAEALGVSVSAVSLWESEKTMPDIALIPAICAVLDVSADELFSINLEKKEEEIDRIIDDAEKYGSRGYCKEALEIIEQGLKKYPDSFKLIEMAMNYHYYLRNTDKVIELGEKILDKCTDPCTRDSAIQSLCFIYQDKDPERVRELLKKTSHIYVSRAVLAAGAYRGDKQIRAKHSLIETTLDLMTQQMWHNIKNDAGELRYTQEETAAVWEKVIAIFHTVFEDGDFGFYHTRLQDAEIFLAQYCADRQDAEEALDHLEKAACHAIEFVKFARFGKNEFVNTSLVLRGQKSGGFSTTGTDNNAQAAKTFMQDTRFDFVRDTEKFRAVTAALDEYAGAWGKLE